MRGALCIAVVILLGACTSILNLDKVASVDRDNDSVPDATDNCPDDANPDQSDFDHNGKGDACDLCTDGGAEDLDHDGIPDGCDGCIGTGQDLDADGIDDGCDPCLGNGMDVDHDGIDDACDSCIGNGMDADHDGIDDACDSCVQKFVDADHDLIDDGCDACVASPPGVDDDGDGIENACDPCPIGPQHDEDGDGIYDACDDCKVIKDTNQPDDDNDGVGNPCDPDSSAPVHFERMDPFTVLDPAWFATGASWTIINNESARLASSAAVSYRWLSALKADAVIETRVKFEISPILIGSPSVAVLASSSISATATREMSCTVDAGGYVTAKVVSGGIAQIAISGKNVDLSTVFDLRMTNSEKQKSVVCQAGNDASAVATIADYGSVWFAGLRVDRGTATFRYFDEIGQLP